MEGAEDNRTQELIDAASDSDLERVRGLVLDGGVSLNAKDSSGRTALMGAAVGGSMDVVRFLVERGADVAAAAKSGRTPLMDATMGGNVDVVRFLVERGADVDAVDSDGWTAMMCASVYGNLDVARFLVERGADMAAVASDGKNALVYATIGGVTDVVRLLVNHGADVDAGDKVGATALMYAAKEGSVDVVEFLVEHGAAVTAVNNDGETVLMNAAMGSSVDVVRYLVQHGADVDAVATNGWAALMYAAMGDSMDVVRLLVECGADVDGVDIDGKTALMNASEEGSIDTVLFLVERGAAVNAVDSDGATALLCASKSGSVDVVRLLIERGADAAAVDVGASTALVYAATGGSVDVVRLLVDEGADVNAADINGKTALMYAAEEGAMDVARFLVEHGADVSAEDGAGRTALFYCSSRGHVDIQRFLTSLVQVGQQRDIGFKHREPAGPSTSSWFISPFEIELLNLIEREGVGVQFRAKWLDADVAVKLFIPGASRATFADEVATWRHLRHPNVIKLYGACDVGHFFFVSELASNGSVVEHLAACIDNEIKCTPWKFLHEAALGLAFLHERKIVHGDLRGSNILVGSDGLAKLSEFALSGSTTRSGLADSTASGVFGSTRWQPPERGEGGEATCASDVYSLGLCIVEAISGMILWSGKSEDDVILWKRDWDPAVDARTFDAPGPLSDDVLGLVAAMCARDPAQRVSGAAAAQMLERLASIEGDGTSQQQQPESEPQTTIDEYKSGVVTRLWDGLHTQMSTVSVDTIQLHAWQEIQAVYDHLVQASRPWKVVEQFHRLLVDIDCMLRADSYENQIQRLSSTRATGFVMDGMRRRLDALWASIDGSKPSRRESQTQLWREARTRQLDLFVSEVEQTLLVLNELATEEDRVTLLAILEKEKDNPRSKYTPGQLSVINKAYEELVERQKQDATTSDAVTTTPEWFIPGDELEIDNANCVGVGGFGGVYRARWLESEVVVKLLDRGGSDVMSAKVLASYLSSASTPQVAPSDSMAPDKEAKRAKLQEDRAKVREMFAREVGVWFGLSHPHVVRLFGACHIKTLFFACEFASNGSLDAYLRTHPDELWQKLYEGALGVQYLHARGIVHGDLKCNNILVGGDGKAKVTDFGLSSDAAALDKADAQLSGAWHWVAPECLAHGSSRLSFASDVYSLGMCIVEALRVVEATAASIGNATEPKMVPLPWQHLLNGVVKHYVVRDRALPPRPSSSVCTDAQWTLVMRMCAFDESDRLSIGVVVDILGRLAGVDTPSVPKAKEKGTDAVAVGLEGVSAAVAEMKSCIDAEQDTEPSSRKTLTQIFGLLWSRLDDLVRVLDADCCSDVGRLWEFVDRSRRSTRAMLEAGGSESLVAFNETAMRGYALHRGLDKLVEVNAWRVDSDGGGGRGGGVHDWQWRCNEFLGLATDMPAVNAVAKALQVETEQKSEA